MVGAMPVCQISSRCWRVVGSDGVSAGGGPVARLCQALRSAEAGGSHLLSFDRLVLCHMHG